MNWLKEEVEKVARLYEETEHRFSEQELDWQRWKQGWLAEKNHYLQRIRELENN